MFDLQGLLNGLFGYLLQFVTTPYLANHNNNIQAILLKNNCTLPNDNNNTDAQILAYQSLRDSLTAENTSGLDHAMFLLDQDSGLCVLLISGILYYFNRDKISFSHYLLIMGGISVGGIVVNNIKQNQADAKHNADLATLKATNNTATQYNLPYSLDKTKIKTYPIGNTMAGSLYYDDPKWSGNLLQLIGSNYYLSDMGTPQQQWFMYDSKTGAFSNTFGNPSYTIPQ